MLRELPEVCKVLALSRWVGALVLVLCTLTSRGVLMTSPVEWAVLAVEWALLAGMALLPGGLCRRSALLLRNEVVGARAGLGLGVGLLALVGLLDAAGETGGAPPQAQLLPKPFCASRVRVGVGFFRWGLMARPWPARPGEGGGMARDPLAFGDGARRGVPPVVLPVRVGEMLLMVRLVFCDGERTGDKAPRVLTGGGAPFAWCFGRYGVSTVGLSQFDKVIRRVRSVRP